MRLTIVKPKKQKTPVGVGAEGIGGDDAGGELPAEEDLPEGEGDPRADEPDESSP